MLKIDVAGEQYRMHVRVGIEKPMLEFARNFVVPGQVRFGHPATSFSQTFQDFRLPASLAPGLAVPVILMQRGYIWFDVTKWGLHDPLTSITTLFKACDRSGIGIPVLVPANFVDIGWDHDEGRTAVRLRPHGDQNLYVGGMGKLGENGELDSVVPLVCEAGADIAPFIPWQPLLVSISCIPSDANFEFVMRRDNGRLQVP